MLETYIPRAVDQGLVFLPAFTRQLTHQFTKRGEAGRNPEHSWEIELFSSHVQDL